jgi:hypothetical protein
MSHFMQGDWRSFVVRNGDPREDQSFHLVINDAGLIQGGSTHGANAVTGNVVQGPAFHQIFIDKATPRKKYKGVLLVNGPQMIICGVANLDPVVNFEGKGDLKEDDIFNFFDQQQEVWIATKP